MRFYDYTLVAGGKVSRREHESAKLLPPAVEVFRDMLERHGDHFRQVVPMVKGYELQFTCQTPGAAVATFWWGGQGASHYECPAVRRRCSSRPRGSAGDAKPRAAAPSVLAC